MRPLGTVKQVKCSFQLWGSGPVDFGAAGVLVGPWYPRGLAEGRAPVGVPHEVEEGGGRCQDDVPGANLMVSGEFLLEAKEYREASVNAPMDLPVFTGDLQCHLVHFRDYVN